MTATPMRPGRRGAARAGGRHATRAAAVAVAPLAILLAACSQALKFSKDDSATVLAHQTITAPNPADPGPFAVKRLYYGSGTDKQRPEYRDSVTYRTKSVDVSPFASLRPEQAGDRKDFFGFDLKSAPINGRVWYPDGDGPFPLVLVVHGNHSYEEFSDPGYAYLGELLASRGFILASVDENFINGGISGENDGRAWLLLKHLEAWKRFTDSSAGPLSHKVDMQRIVLMGHSRGGEAVAHAATFNRLKYYPDDFRQKFNFNFAIKGVVAIAPVDGQYQPASRLEPLDNVNYLLIHGSHDGDVSTFAGIRQYERLRFTDGQPHFKAIFYMYRANHGQWNTVWNNKDNGPRSGRSLDLRSLVPPEDQRQFAKVVISAFLEATLHRKTEYLPLFRDHRTAGHWFPKSMYTTRFQESGYRPLAEFDDDVDLTTGEPGVTIAGDSLSTWKENVIPFRGRGADNQRNNAAWIAWNNRIAGPDTMRTGQPARFTITLSDSLVRALAITPRGAIYYSAALTKERPAPRALPRDTTTRDTSKAAIEARRKAAADSAKRAPKPPKYNAEADTLPVDYTVELVDAEGHVARMPASRYGPVRRPLEARIYRRAGRDEERFANLFEYVPQTYVLPLADFAGAGGGFDPARLRAIRFVFDRTVLGGMIVDDVGINPAMDPAYLASRGTP
jgi:dienelactone hydrolase